METLQRDAATLLAAEAFGDLLPRLALLALFADKINERFNATAKGPPTSVLRYSTIFGFRIHQRTVYSSVGEFG
jgi:hypothetical protein